MKVTVHRNFDHLAVGDTISAQKNINSRDIKRGQKFLVLCRGDTLAVFCATEQPFLCDVGSLLFNTLFRDVSYKPVFKGESKNV